MGHIKHHTIVVTGWEAKEVDEAHKKAIEIFKEFLADELFKFPCEENIISPIIGSCNSQKSFFIAPDGSKEGWATSNNCNKARTTFLNWLKYSDNCCDYIELAFGGDDEYQAILRTKDTDLYES